MRPTSCNFVFVHGKSLVPPQKCAVGPKSEWEGAGEGVHRHAHRCPPLQSKWGFLEAVWFNTSVSVAAVPAFHDSAFHHLKHVIAFDDNKRIVARELSTVSENTEPPALQVRSALAEVVLGQGRFQTQRGGAWE